ncbi:hypothetical protein C6P45_002459 [Maudiozyma exigua]|uniref:Uncharacterized protein n=1 Tax=Maudiozyma exigua TaxID=34358 RepID=A0A9P6VYH2_MAUEX|nr:hypothetical protein C6P45_002459 [Kazachstania exigua]
MRETVKKNGLFVDDDCEHEKSHKKQKKSEVLIKSDNSNVSNNNDEIMDYWEEENSSDGYQEFDSLYNDKDNISENESISDDEWEDVALDKVITVNIPSGNDQISLQRNEKKNYQNKD